MNSIFEHQKYSEKTSPFLQARYTQLRDSIYAPTKKVPRKGKKRNMQAAKMSQESEAKLRKWRGDGAESTRRSVATEGRGDVRTGGAKLRYNKR